MSRANWKGGIPRHLNKTRHPEVPQDTSHTWHLFVTGTVWFQVIQACKADEDLQFWRYLLRMVKDANKLSEQAPKAYTKKTLAPQNKSSNTFKWFLFTVMIHLYHRLVHTTTSNFKDDKLPKHARWTEAPTLQVELDHLIFWQVKDLVLEKMVANRREKQQMPGINLCPQLRQMFDDSCEARTRCIYK